MPKKKKSKFTGSSTEHSISGDVIRNQFVSGDGSNPAESLKSLQEIFRGKLDGDVVQLVFSECGFNVDQALESLFTLTAENELHSHSGGLSSRSAGLQERMQRWQHQTDDLVSLEPDILSQIQSSSSQNPFFKHVLPKPPQYSDTHFYEYLGNRSNNWTAVSNSSDSSSANESELSDSVARHQRHHHLADVVCHNADTEKPKDAPLLPLPSYCNVAEFKGESTQYDTTSPRADELTSSVKETPTGALEDILQLIKSNERCLVVLRGLPGSGKTTLAKQIRHNGIVLSTDDYFSLRGLYNFNPAKLPEAHEWNKERALAALRDCITPILIDNTNIEAWEMLPYLSLAMKNNYIPKILEPETPWKFRVSELAKKNTHRVSKEKIARMFERYEHGLTVDDVIKRRHSGYKHMTEDIMASNSSISSRPSASSKHSSSSPSTIMLENLEESSSSSPTNSLQSRSSGGDFIKSAFQTNPEVLPSVFHSEERLGLEDLKALTQQDSEDSISPSRRTSASSSQDASGWECDEEFTWTREELETINARYSRYLAEEIPEEETETSIALDPPPSSNSVEENHEKDVEIEADLALLLTSVKIDEIAQPVITELSEIPSLDPILSTDVKILETTELPTNDIDSGQYLEEKLPESVEVFTPKRRTNPNRPVFYPSYNSPVIDMTEWSIPSYPVEDASLVFKKESLIVPPVRDPICYSFNETQTTALDFSILNQISDNSLASEETPNIRVISSKKNLHSEEVIETLFVPISLPEMRNPPMFDKSTLTEELDGELTADNKLKLLGSMFPSVSLEDLEDILQKCVGDHNWAINSLLDFGLEYNDPNTRLKPIEIKNSEVKSSFKNGDINLNHLEDKPTHENGASIDSSGATSNELFEKNTNHHSLNKLVLPLSSAFAMQLEEMFGAGTVDYKDVTQYEKLQISIPIDMARAIFNLWQEQCGTPGVETNSIQSIKKAKSPVKVLHIEQKFTPAGVPNLTTQARSAASETMPLSEIMEMEAELQDKMLEKEKERIANGEDMATRLKRQKLYSLFPGVDRTALDDIFEINQCSLPHSLLTLEEALGHGPNGTPLFSMEVAKEAEDELVSLVVQESQQDHVLFDDDWQSWVAEDDSELINFPNHLLAETGYAEIRAEASVHYDARQECYRKGQDAFQRGMKAVAAFYSRQGRLHTQKIKEANMRAASKILEIRNTRHDPNILDLHGLHVAEAIKAMENYLIQRTDDLKSSALNKIVVFVITGRGNHSQNKQPKIKPAVEDFLQRNQYRFEAIHDGLFKVIIT